MSERRAYAEVIGCPVGQSKSPSIHRHWLESLGIAGDYFRTELTSDELPGFLALRSPDPNWRGCNVTIPHKQAIIPLLDRLDPGALAIGAVNCVVPEGGFLVGYNTDIDGIAAALHDTEIRGRKAVVIGAGGAARAVISYLASREIGEIALVARSRDRAEPLLALAPDAAFSILSFDQAEAGLEGADVIVNASPLGMTGADAMPQPLLNWVSLNASKATVFDLVTTPATTEFLLAGQAAGGLPVDGLTMLVGQAARAFLLFFGSPAPAPDAKLRDLLTTDRLDSA